MLKNFNIIGISNTLETNESEQVEVFVKIQPKGEFHNALKDLTKKITMYTEYDIEHSLSIWCCVTPENNVVTKDNIGILELNIDMETSCEYDKLFDEFATEYELVKIREYVYNCIKDNQSLN